MTEKLYYTDPHRTEFSAALIDQNREDTKEGPRWRVRVSATCFFPEGGGQPADRGTLNDRIVADVRNEGDEVVHLLEAPLDEGTSEVFGRIEPLHRRHYMQQHTGQHILSAVLQRRCGRATRSVHLGAGYTSVEVEGGMLSPFEIIEVEDAANRIVCENRPVHGFFPDPEELERLSLRRSLKADSNIRLVEIADLDLIGCGGVHCERTGEVRLIKHLSSETVRGNCRLSFVIGDEAMADYRRKSALGSRLVDLLSAPDAAVAGALEEYVARNAERDRRLTQLTKERNELLAARLLAEKGRESEAGRIVVALLDRDRSDSLREIGEELARLEPAAALLAAETEKGFRWVVYLPEAAGIGFGFLKERLLPLFDGKGGGRAPFYQGAGSPPVEFAALAEAFFGLLETDRP